VEDNEMVYNREIWDELKAQHELSRMLWEGVLGWAKVCDGSGQEAHIYLPTTLELLHKMVTNIADSPEKVQRIIKEITEIRNSNQQKVIVEGLSQYSKKLKAFQDDAIKLTTMGEQAKKGEEDIYLTKITQKLYEMAESMEVVSVQLEVTLLKIRDKVGRKA
jgi:hypothetical protein